MEIRQDGMVDELEKAEVLTSMSDFLHRGLLSFGIDAIVRFKDGVYQCRKFQLLDLGNGVSTQARNRSLVVLRRACCGRLYDLN